MRKLHTDLNRFKKQQKGIGDKKYNFYKKSFMLIFYWLIVNFTFGAQITLISPMPAYLPSAFASPPKENNKDKINNKGEKHMVGKNKLKKSSCCSVSRCVPQ